MAPYDSLNAANLTGGYFFGGNPETVKGLSLNLGIDNLADKKPPTPRNPGTFNTFPDTYNVVGRSYGLSATMKF